MDDVPTGNEALEIGLWKLYRRFFNQAERRRRWNLEADIPWSQCRRDLNPAIADVVESFCAIELYLPDYLQHAMSRSRPSRARTWFYANWGYEESKHSLALGDWLLQSGSRTEEQMADVEGLVSAHVYKLPHESTAGMLAYAMVQERATALNYRNLKRRTSEQGGDPALEKLLTLISVDEQSHYSFFQDAIKLYLNHDPESTLEQLRDVMNGFSMPAIHELADGARRVARIKELDIFGEEHYYREVYIPILDSLGIDRARLRNRIRTRKSAPLPPVVDV
ncbi:acyl-ACP desaturase [bacterium]|nr:acyl-ACP desaturase [bacterium]